MKGLVVLTGITVLAMAVTNTRGQEKNRPVAQGAYSMVGIGDENGNKKDAKLDEWRMYTNLDGSYAVEIEAATQGATLKERYALTSDLKPKSFSLAVSSKEENASGESVTISCNFDTERIACHTAGNGVNASPALAEKLPYVFMPTAAAPSLDLPWFFQTVGSQAGRSTAQKSAIPLIAIEDGDTTDSTILRVQEIEQVEYLGQEKIDVVGQTVIAHKFRVSDPASAIPEDLWLSDSGLLLRLTQQGNPSLLLTSYEGPPLGGQH